MALVDRVRNIIVQPAAEWPVIAMEATTPAALYTGYVIPLAAIPAVCGFVSSFITLHNPVLALVLSVIQYVFALIIVFLVALLAEALAPSFDGAKDRMAALKLMAYGNTPAWVAGVFLLIPFLGAFVALIGALYGLYVLYLGVGPMMRVPPQKQVGYIIVLILTVIVLYVIVGIIIGAVTTAMIMATAAATGGFSH